MQETFTLHYEGSAIPVMLHPSPRARRISVQVSNARAEVRLTYPKRTPLKRALAFLHSKQAWVAGQVARFPPAVPFVEGSRIPVLGETYTLCHEVAARGSAWLEEDRLVITCLAEFYSRHVWDFLKKTLLAEIRVLSGEYSKRLNVTVRKIALRDTVSRWGSCSASGNLSFSTRLVFAPRGIVAYLVAHEVAHLKHMDHSKAFWEAVALLCPHYRQARLWLKTHGAALHRYG